MCPLNWFSLKSRTTKPEVDVFVDGVYSYKTPIRLASEQVPCRSQGTLLPSTVNPVYRIRGTNV
jgi:hypothetical protein